MIFIKIIKLVIELTVVNKMKVVVPKSFSLIYSDDKVNLIKIIYLKAILKNIDCH